MLKAMKRKLKTINYYLRGYKKRGFHDTMIKLIEGVVFTFTGQKHWSLKRKRKLLGFEFRIVEHCNLNCRSCSTFAPLATESYLSVESVEKDLLQMKSLTKERNIINVITISGGETLLHPNLVEIIDKVRFHFPKLSSINMFTNGLLVMKMGDDFWESCKKNKVFLLVTKYPNMDYDKVIKRINEKGIKYRFFNNIEEDKKMWKYNINLEGTENHKKQFASCCKGNICLELNNGKFYSCAFPAHIHNFNNYFNQSIPITQKDFLDIHSVKDIDEILSFAKTPMPICRYCNSQYDADADIPWSISKREISEWAE